MKSNPTNRFRSARAGALTTLIMLPMASSVSAANLYWEGVGVTQSPFNPPSQPLVQFEIWQTAANWDTAADGSGGAPGTAPTTGDIAIFNTTVNNGTRGALLNASRSIDGLIINNTGTTGIAAETSTVRALAIGASGLTVNSGAGAVTFGTGSRPLTLRLLASQTWLNGSSALVRHLNGGSTDTNLDLQTFTLTVDGSGDMTFASGAMPGSAATAVIKSGAGVLTFNVVDKDVPGVGSAAFTGDVQINAGTVRYGVASALPSSADVIFNTASGTATLDLNGFSGTIKSLTIDGAVASGAAITTGAGTLTLGGDVFYNSAIGTPNGATITGNLNLGAASRTFEIRDSSATTNELDVSAVISGTGVGFTKTSNGVMTLSGLNTFTGAVVVRDGTLSVNTLADGGSNSSLGAGSGAVQLGLGATAGILQYTGDGDSTNRQIQIGRNGTVARNAETGGGVIENMSGSGVLTFSNTGDFNAPLTGVTATRNLTLRGTNTGLNTISGVIADNDSFTGGIVALVKEGAGTWVLAGANVYTGETSINGGTLALGNSSVLASSTDIKLGTATLDAATFTNSVSTLDVTGSATINLGTGAVLSFTNSSGVDWTGGTLNITGAFVSGSSIFFGVGGLDLAQLGLITLNGVPTTFTLNGSGFLATGAVSGYAAWQAANSTAQAANLDHDNDGISNGVEHFLGGIGNTTGNSNPMPSVINTAGTLSVTWVRHPDFPGFPANYGTGFLVETSATLANPWTAAVQGIGAGFVEISGNNVKYTFPAGTKNFARLKVVAP